MEGGVKKPDFEEMFGADTVEKILEKFKQQEGEKTISLQVDKRIAIYELYYEKPTIH